MQTTQPVRVRFPEGSHWSVIGFDSALNMPAPSGPTLCDLTGDKTACAILHALSRQPWKQENWNALIDRLHDLGYDLQADRIRNYAYWNPVVTNAHSQGPRRTVRRICHLFRAVLMTYFGDFETTFLRAGLDTD